MTGQRLLDGDWDAVQSIDNPFLFAFDATKHVRSDVEYNPNLPIIVSIDFNINPFCATFAAISARMLHFTMRLPSRTEIFRKWQMRSGQEYLMAKWVLIKITGDAMGKRGEIAVRSNHSNYTQLATCLICLITTFTSG